ncbi:ortholog of Bordetella pertussis (BX470248) BP2750 [plant metagenome]|uniref:Ortholog of Bordetella pertussis (BX470248) BP2750 n=2 Tax=plant metagenome TaxID=1297885 RepID=A0A484TN18_9ZZZZ
MTRRPLPLLLAALMASACSTQPASFHTLASPIAATPASAGPQQPAFDALSVDVPTMLDRHAMVVRHGAHGVTVEAAQRWASPFPEEVRDAIKARLTQASAPRSAAGAAAATPRFIKVDILRVDAWLDDHVAIDAAWTLHFKAPDRPALHARGVFLAPAQGGFAGLAAAQQRAVSALADCIARDLALTPPDDPALHPCPRQRRP